MKKQLRNLICYPFYNSFCISFCGSCVAILLLFIPIVILEKMKRHVCGIETKR